MCKKIAWAIKIGRWKVLPPASEQLFDNQTLLRTILIDYITCELPPKKKV